MNGDGVIGALDAQAILTAVVGLPLPGGFAAANGDANCDAGTQPTAIDAQIVLMYVIGLNTSSYCVGQTFGPGATTVALTPRDSSVLMTRTQIFKAILRQSDNSIIHRPTSWTSSNPAVASIDSVKNDSVAYVRGVSAGSSTISAQADGASASTKLQVVASYAGVIIQPQKPDTIGQIGSTRGYTARNRDSVGNISGFPPGFWTSADTNILQVTAPAPGVAANSVTVQAQAVGTTYLRLTDQANSSSKDSLPISVVLPSVNSCIAGTGTLHYNVSYSTPQHWTVATQPHFVQSLVQFNAGANLTIDPGVLVCMMSGAEIQIHDGARLSAVGTVANPITFTSDVPSSMWYWIQLGDAASYNQPTTDTSVIKNALMENTYYGIYSYHHHVTTLDSVHIRQFGYNAVQFYTSGSKMSRSTVDSTRVGYNGTAVTLYRGTLDQSVVRTGGPGIGISLGDSSVVTSDSVIGGNPGINGACCSSWTTQINDLAVVNTTGLGMDMSGVVAKLGSGNVTIANAGSYAFSGDIANVGSLFADSLRQETLKGHARDTIVVTGGSLHGATVLMRGDLPWIMTTTTYVDTLAQIVAHPGATLRANGGALTFRAGGTLDAHGTAAAPVRFVNAPGGFWTGLAFNSPGAGANPFYTAPVSQSTLINVRVDSASGTSVNGGAYSYYAAIIGADRHRLIVDSAIVRYSVNGGVYLNARGSSLSRSRIDTTGNATTSYSAVALADSTTMEGTLVRRSGNTGGGAVYAGGNGVRLINDTITDGLGSGLEAHDGIIKGDSGSVVISGNLYPGRFRIENLAVLARDSVALLNWKDNADSVLAITAGTLRSDTVFAIPQFRWQVEGAVVFDTLSQFVPRPGARISFYSSNLAFNAGGTLDARGTAADPIKFYAMPGRQWAGLAFNSPGAGGNPFATAPVAQSYLINVKVDSATGTSVNSGAYSYYAAIIGADRHRLTVDSAVVRFAYNGAVYLNARGSSLSRSRIDTTGNATTSYSAVALADTTTMEATLVRRSGNTSGGAVYAGGSGVRLIADTIRDALGPGIEAHDGVIKGDYGSLVVTNNAYPGRFRIENLALLARDSVAQDNLLGNSDDVIVLVGTQDLKSDTVTAIPQLRWQVEQTITFDTLSQFVARPGARISFYTSQMTFSAGGTLDARGTNKDPIKFYPLPGRQWAGLAFNSPGAGGNPFATAPVAQSYLTNVRVDSATGVSVNSGTAYYYAAIVGADRHRLFIDSARVRFAYNGAVYINARGSTFSRSVVDTTGNATTGYNAVALGDTTTMEQVTVRRAGTTPASGAVGVWAYGSGARLVNDTIIDGLSAGIQAQEGLLKGDSGSVVIRNNNYPGRFRIENVAVLLPDSLAQDNLLGNTQNLMVVYGGTLVNDTAIAIPQLQWQVENSPIVGTGSNFAPHPGSTLLFNNSGMDFNSGGTIYAVGTATDSIRFGPVGPGVNFYGMAFNNPSAGADVSSTMQFVNVDSASGRSAAYWGCCAAINAADHHQLNLSEAHIRKSFTGAVYAAAIRSAISDVVIDTTGAAGTGTSSYAALAVKDTVSLQNVNVRRSGQVGLHVRGIGGNMFNVVIDNSMSYGIEVYSGAAGAFLSNFEVMNGAVGGVAIDVSNVTLQNCMVHDNGTLASDHGVFTTSSYTGVVVTSCNLENNAGNGVNNQNTGNGTYLITADFNWWGDPAGPNGPAGDGVGLNVSVNNPCSFQCGSGGFMPLGSGTPSTPAIPVSEVVWRESRRKRRKRRST